MDQSGSRNAAGEALGLAERFSAGWPGERALHAAAANRTHVALTRLRNLGLRGILQSRDDGVLLDPAVPLVWGDD